MSKRKSQSKSKSRRKNEPPPRVTLRERLAGIDWPRIGRTTHALIWVLGIGGLAAAAVIGVPRLEARAAARAGVLDPASVEIRFLRSPAWMAGDLRAALDATARQYLAADPFSRDDLVAARAALIDTGWFDEVRQVRRRADHVEIDATFAVPYAVIRDGDGDHLVDPRGRLLPRSYPTGGKPSFVAISGVRYERPQRAGLQWEGADVAAALGLLGLIRDQPWLGQVASINTARFLSEQTLVLVTDRGCHIIWGREPGAESVSEVPASQKLQYLDYHYQTYNHIDRGFAHELDITGDIVIGR